MATYFCNKSKNPNYLVQISCPGHNTDIIADLPEQIGFGVTSDWESLLPYSLAGMIDQIPLVGNWAKAAAGAKALNVQSQALSFQVWLGTSPIEIPLHLQFDAYSSALEEVYKPILLLESFTLPITQQNYFGGLAGNILTAPGPVLGGANQMLEGYGLNVRLGRQMLFQNCIVSASNHNFDTRLDKDGYPIAGEIEMTLRTSVVFGNLDLLTAAGISLEGGSTSGAGGAQGAANAAASRG